jgi:hypothetical protein
VPDMVKYPSDTLWLHERIGHYVVDPLRINVLFNPSICEDAVKFDNTQPYDTIRTRGICDGLLLLVFHYKHQAMTFARPVAGKCGQQTYINIRCCPAVHSTACRVFCLQRINGVGREEATPFSEPTVFNIVPGADAAGFIRDFAVQRPGLEISVSHPRAVTHHSSHLFLAIPGTHLRLLKSERRVRACRS